jgi:hypothetical protein
VKSLTQVWKRFSGACEDLFEDAGLKDPHEAWKLDCENKKENSPFKKLAKVLNRAEEDDESAEAEFVHDMRELIIQTRAEVKEILEAAEK